MQKRPMLLGGFAMAASMWLGAERMIWFTSRTDGESEWRVAAAADSVPQSIAEAEAHGRRYPRISADTAFAPYVHAAPALGTAERRCVEIGEANEARSGEIFAGPFVLYARYWNDGVHPPPKVSWHGSHRPRPGVPAQLTLRVARLDTIGPPFVYRGPTRTVGRGYTYPYGIGDAAMFDLPTTGTWLFVATMAEEWGCFVYVLK